MFDKIFCMFKLVVILNLFLCLINMEWTAIFVCIFNFLLFYVADLFKEKLNYGDFFQLLVYLFLISSLLGGEVYFLYAKVWYFDIILHILSSFLVSGLCFYSVKFFKSSICSEILIIFIFSFAMMVAALWEITEFSLDRLFGIDMQKDTIITEINSVLLSEDGKTVINKKISSMNIGEYTVKGYIDIGLYDTIDDMVCAILGSFLFIVVRKLINF